MREHLDRQIRKVLQAVVHEAPMTHRLAVEFVSYCVCHIVWRHTYCCFALYALQRIHNQEM